MSALHSAFGSVHRMAAAATWLLGANAWSRRLRARRLGAPLLRATGVGEIWLWSAITRGILFIAFQRGCRIMTCDFRKDSYSALLGIHRVVAHRKCDPNEDSRISIAFRSKSPLATPDSNLATAAVSPIFVTLFPPQAHVDVSGRTAVSFDRDGALTLQFVDQAENLVQSRPVIRQTSVLARGSAHWRITLALRLSHSPLGIRLVSFESTGLDESAPTVMFSS